MWPPFEEKSLGFLLSFLDWGGQVANVIPQCRLRLRLGAALLFSGCQGQCDQVTGVSLPPNWNEYATNHVGVDKCCMDFSEYFIASFWRHLKLLLTRVQF